MLYVAMLLYALSAASAIRAAYLAFPSVQALSKDLAAAMSEAVKEFRRRRRTRRMRAEITTPFD